MWILALINSAIRDYWWWVSHRGALVCLSGLCYVTSSCLDFLIYEEYTCLVPWENHLTAHKSVLVMLHVSVDSDNHIRGPRGQRLQYGYSWMKCELLTPSPCFPILTLQSTEGTWNEDMGWHGCQKAHDTANHVLQVGLRQRHCTMTVQLYCMQWLLGHHYVPLAKVCAALVHAPPVMTDNGVFALSGFVGDRTSCSNSASTVSRNALNQVNASLNEFE